jgi:hypothetical protein
LLLYSVLLNILAVYILPSSAHKRSKKGARPVPTSKVRLRTSHEGPRGSRSIAPILFLPRGWVVKVAPRPPYPRERPVTHCIGCWVSPRDECRKSCLLPGIRSSERPARSESVFGKAVITFIPLLVRTDLSPLYPLCEPIPT